MGKTRTLVFLLSLSVAITACSTGCASRCISSDELVARFAALRDADRRNLSQDIVRVWHASPQTEQVGSNSVNLPASESIVEHVGALNGTDCVCCESLTLSDAKGSARNGHLEAVAVLREATSFNEALTFLRNLVRGATGSDLDSRRLAELRPDADAEMSLGWPETERDTMLDIRLSKRGHKWVANVYWGRFYRSEPR